MEKSDQKMRASPSDELVLCCDSIKPAYISLVGAKAIGLSNLPQSWLPKFFVLTTILGNKWNARHTKKKGTTTKCEQILTDREKELIADAAKSLNVPYGGRVIVRSSSPEEGIELRGRLISKVAEATAEAILASCDTIYQDASSEYVKKHFGLLDLAVIVQVYVEPKACGHLSNERRVAKRRQEWLYEFEYGQKGPSIGRFALKYGRSRTLRATTSQLTAFNEKDLIRQLRSVAAYIDNEKLRLHIEWVWDRQRLWIVQGDKDPEVRGKNPKSYLSAIRSSQSTVTLKSFVNTNCIVHDRWHKLQCPKDFKSAGLPTADLWILEDSSIISDLQNGSITEALKQDIETLLSSPIVVRMDIKQSGSIPPEILPRSDCLTVLGDAEEFFTRESRSMLSSGKGTTDFCFIVHHYIPSRSSAFCLAHPHHSRVRLDSIWGLPDGLLYYPHDSFELDLDNLGSIKKHIRFKDNYLAPSAHGEWIPVRAGRPWDWIPSVTDEELISIGRDSKRLANYVDSCVQIMWLVDIPSNTGLPSLLPWWYTKGEPPAGAHEADPRIFNRNRVFISTQDDLNKISIRPGANLEGTVLRVIPKPELLRNLEGTVLRVIPKPELLRNNEFLRAVADKAKEYDLPVELQGSILSHAYYHLKQSGVRVQCVDFFMPVSRTQRFGKLVRDLIPIRIQSGGERVYTITLSGEDMIKVLKAKAVEEALELLSATNVGDIKDELGDILEVILSLAERVDFSREELNEKVEQKRKERGGFQEGLLLIETEDVPLIDIEKSTYRLARKGEKARLPLLDTEGGGATITTRRTPQRHNGVIIIPLVPPDIREAALKLEDLGVVLKIKYEDKEIVLHFSHEAPQIPPEQLRFKFD